MKRRKKLREKWFFDCVCKRCKDPMELGSHVSTLKCSNDSCSGLIIPKSSEDEDQICSKCGLIMSPDEIESKENEYDNFYLIIKFIPLNVNVFG